MKKQLCTLSICLYTGLSVAQQSIELKPGQMTFKGQGAELNDRLTSDGNGVANFKTKQEVVVVRNNFSMGGAQSFASGTAVKMDFDNIRNEKKNNTGSNFNLVDDVMLVEESGLYVFDLDMQWVAPAFTGDIVIRVLTTNNSSLEYFSIRRSANDPIYQRFMGLVHLRAADQIYLELTQTNNDRTTKNAIFSWSIGKL